MQSWTALSIHAGQRLRQRSLREHDVELILACGTDLGDGRITLYPRDAERAIIQRKQEIERLQHLRNAVVIAAGKIVTVYRADSNRRRKSMRLAVREALS